MLNQLKKKIHNILYKKDRCIVNVNIDVTDKNQKRVAFIYLDHYLFESGSRFFKGHSSVLESSVIVSELIRRGYCIDIVNVFQETSEIMKKLEGVSYDLIIGFGDIFNQLCKRNLDAIRILYATENSPDFSYKKEKERFDYYFERHSLNYKLERSLVHYNHDHFLDVDFIICMGDQDNFLKYGVPVYTVFPSGLKNEKFNSCELDLINIKNDGKVKFIWLGSKGVVHKGLDVLCEAFDQCSSNYELHAYGVDKKEKSKLRFSNDKNNIYLYDRIDIDSQDFLNVIYDFDYVILISCSEGFSTGIMTGMLHGLIPIVTRNIGMNLLGDRAIYVDSYKVEGIVKKITSISKESCRFSHRDLYDYANREFTIDSYRKRIRNVLEEILSEN